MILVTPPTSTHWYIGKARGRYAVCLINEKRSPWGNFPTLAEARQYATQTAPEHRQVLSDACVREMQAEASR